jgi:hypothetical protein
MRLNIEWVLIAFLGIGAMACSDLPVADQKSIAANYTLYSVNGGSPTARVQFNIGGDMISIPHGSLVFRKDGTVTEIVQYVVYRANSNEQIAATDTTVGHYELSNRFYDIRMPGADGSESFSGTLNVATDFVQLSRSWMNGTLRIGVDIAYSKTN